MKWILIWFGIGLIIASIWWYYNEQTSLKRYDEPFLLASFLFETTQQKEITFM